MQKRFSFPILAIFIFVIFVVQSCAAYWHLYFRYWWLDIPVHIMGGTWIALFGLASYYSSVNKKEYSPLFVFSLAVATTLVVGLAWEIFEFTINRGIGDVGISLGDTLKDLVDDFVGALIGGAIFLRGGYNKGSLS